MTFISRHTVPTRHTLHKLNNNYFHCLLISFHSSYASEIKQLNAKLFSFCNNVSILQKVYIMGSQNTWRPLAQSLKTAIQSRVKLWVLVSRALPHHRESYITCLNWHLYSKTTYVMQANKLDTCRTKTKKHSTYTHYIQHSAARGKRARVWKLYTHIHSSFFNFQSTFTRSEQILVAMAPLNMPCY